MKLRATLVLALLMSASSSGQAEDNEDEVKAAIKARHDDVKWGKKIDHLEYAKFIASCGGGAPGVAAYLKGLAAEIVILTGVQVADATVFDLVTGKKRIDEIGGKTVYVQIATINHWRNVPYPRVNIANGTVKQGTFRMALPNEHLFYVAVGRKQPPGAKTADGLPERFRAVNDWVVQNGFKATGGFPNMNKDSRPDINAGKPTYHAWVFMPGTVVWRDVPFAEVGNGTSDRERFTYVSDWATKKDPNRAEFIGGFPNFHEGIQGGQRVFGAFMVKKEYAEWRDVPAAKLGNPKSMEERCRAVHIYAQQLGDGKTFATGFPNGHEATINGELKYGCILIKDGAVTHRYIPVAELNDYVK